jgi:hypothetical protein
MNLFPCTPTYILRYVSRAPNPNSERISIARYTALIKRWILASRLDCAQRVQNAGKTDENVSTDETTPLAIPDGPQEQR